MLSCKRDELLTADDDNEPASGGGGPAEAIKEGAADGGAEEDSNGVDADGGSGDAAAEDAAAEAEGNAQEAPMPSRFQAATGDHLANCTAWMPTEALGDVRGYSVPPTAPAVLSLDQLVREGSVAQFIWTAEGPDKPAVAVSGGTVLELLVADNVPLMETGAMRPPLLFRHQPCLVKRPPRGRRAPGGR